MTRSDQFTRAADEWARLMEWQPTTDADEAEKRRQMQDVTAFMGTLLEMPKRMPVALAGYEFPTWCEGFPTWHEPAKTTEAC
jgi:hypothetical protein